LHLKFNALIFDSIFNSPFNISLFMKKLVLSLIACGLVMSAQAQTPKKESIGLVNKISGTWCGPCGTWGWEMAEELITQTSGKALYVGIFVGQDSYGNDKFKNSTGSTLEGPFSTPAFGGVPDFGANAIGRMVSTPEGYVNTTQSKSNIITAINNFAATTPLASPASTMKVTGNTVTANAKVQFWSAATGEYYLAAYLIEDGAMNLQNGQSGTVAHHGVMRGSMSAGMPWGEQIAMGSIPANQTYSKTFTFTVAADANWDKTKFKIYTVIWKKNGSSYEFVNAAKHSAATGIESIASTEDVSIFPNPASDKAILAITAVSAMDINIQVTDVTGRSVYASENKVVKGSNSFDLPISQLTSGVYNVTINSKDGKMNQRLVINR
jgi:hypothetical protein